MDWNIKHILLWETENQKQNTTWIFCNRTRKLKSWIWGKNSRRVYLRTGARRGRATSKKRRQQRRTGGFLSRYDFAYAGRYTVNQVGKIAPAIIKQATGQIDKNAQDRINQVIRSGGAEVERLLPKIICRAIEDVYKTLFRLLGNLGKQQFQKIKKNIKKY